VPLPAVLAAQGVLQREAPVLVQPRLYLVPHPLAVLLDDQVAEEHPAAGELLGGVSGELQGVVADELVGPAGLVAAAVDVGRGV
jgi:hypothetical protein